MGLENILKPESNRKSAAPKENKKTSNTTESAFTFTVTGAPKDPTSATWDKDNKITLEFHDSVGAMNAFKEFGKIQHRC